MVNRLTMERLINVFRLHFSYLITEKSQYNFPNNKGT